MERRPDRFTAIIDANVLVCGLKRHLLLNLAEAGFFARDGQIEFWKKSSAR